MCIQVCIYMCCECDVSPQELYTSFETQFLSSLELAEQFRPVSPRDPLIATSPVLGSQVHTARPGCSCEGWGPNPGSYAWKASSRLNISKTQTLLSHGLSEKDSPLFLGRLMSSQLSMAAIWSMDLFKEPSPPA